MSEDSQRNSGFIAASQSKVHHASTQDLPQGVVERLYRAGTRSGEPARTTSEAVEMLHKVPPAQRAGIDANTARACFKTIATS